MKENRLVVGVCVRIAKGPKEKKKKEREEKRKEKKRNEVLGRGNQNTY